LRLKYLRFAGLFASKSLLASKSLFASKSLGNARLPIPRAPDRKP
jgi:hypothetical protein